MVLREVYLVLFDRTVHRLLIYNAVEVVSEVGHVFSRMSIQGSVEFHEISYLAWVVDD